MNPPEKLGYNYLDLSNISVSDAIGVGVNYCIAISILHKHPKKIRIT